MLPDGVGDGGGVVGHADPVFEDGRNVQAVETGAHQLEKTKLREMLQVRRLEGTVGVDEHLAIGEGRRKLFRRQSRVHESNVEVRRSELAGATSARGVPVLYEHDAVAHRMGAPL